jgi:RimJ/RimL family protein N-acetyltransferase
LTIAVTAARRPRVRLRDVTLDDADMLDAWVSAVHGTGGFNDLADELRRTDRKALAQGPLRNDESGQLIVERIADGAPIGTVGWHRVGYGPRPRSDAWNIGIELLPSARGRGYGSEAQRLLADYLFETTSVNRVEASTDVENLAEQRALEKAGYRREGIARGAQFRAGAYHDLVTYARLRGDPRRRRSEPRAARRPPG